MGRRAEGLKVVWRDGWGYARFTWDKARHFIATGERDPARAEEKARAIYAEVVSGRRRRVNAAVRVLQPLEVLFADWLATLEGILDEETVKTYRVTYVPRFVRFFKSLDRAVDDADIDAFGRDRLRNVLRKTLHKELGAFRQFLRWCKTEGIIDRLPAWPEYPRTAKGKRSGKQRAKPNELTEEQVVSEINRLPLLSDRISRRDRKPYAVRARFIVAYEMGFRPATLDAISVPEDWAPGRDTIRIDDEDDKARFGRVLTLTPSAKAALEHTVETLGIKSGPIFGKHDCRTYLARAGVHGLASYDFRHARGTHLQERGATLPGTAFLLGHTQITTTNKYTHPNRKAGDAAIGVGGADLSGSIPEGRGD